jgi:simple sugar transport system permease protein
LISAVGMTFVIISGGIDLSVAGVWALTSVAAAALLRAGWNPWVVIPLMLLMGMALGATMGSFITYLKVQPFIATLAGLWFARGMCFFISDDAIAIENWVWQLLGQTRILIPGLAELAWWQGGDPPYVSISVVVAILVFVVAIYMAHFTRYGRTIYAIGGYNGANEQSARLMGLPVDRTKVLIYTFNGFCSALAGLAYSIFVMSGHGFYAQGLELEVIAAVVIGGTMLTGGEGYIFGTLFGVLVLGVTQVLIQFNGELSSWWSRIVTGALTFIFISIQSVLLARKARRQIEEKEARAPGTLLRRRMLFGGSAFVAVVLVTVLAINLIPQGNEPVATEQTQGCELKPYRQEQAASLIAEGAVVAYERNGGTRCIDELYAVYPDGRIVGDNGLVQAEKQVTPEEVNTLLSGISNYGWFTDEMYDTWHTPCRVCYGYYLTVVHDGQEKTVKGVDGGTDAPADYWQVISLVKGIIPAFPAAAE